jgi:hypothetical protein
MSRQSFMQEFIHTTDLNPMSSKERVWQWKVCFWIGEMTGYANGVHLKAIRSLERGKSHGSAGLRWLCQLADRHGVSLCGFVQPIYTRTQPRLTKRQLKSWYSRYGFIIGDHDNMIRCPQKSEQNIGQNTACGVPVGTCIIAGPFTK